MNLLVAAMGASSYVYAEARPSEGLADWIGCHVGLFAFLGAVPAIIVSDNLKAGVTKPDRYEPGINRTYQDMDRHYGTSVIPARHYKPRDNAKVEQSVLRVERWVQAKLRNQRFVSQAELNLAIAELVAERNHLGFAVQLALIRHPGLTLAQVTEQPGVDLEPLVGFIASQLQLPTAALADYATREQTMTDHARELGAALGLRRVATAQRPKALARKSRSTTSWPILACSL